MKGRNFFLIGLLLTTTVGSIANAIEEREIKLNYTHDGDPYIEGAFIIPMSERVLDTINELKKQKRTLNCVAKTNIVPVSIDKRSRQLQVFSLRDCR